MPSMKDFVIFMILSGLVVLLGIGCLPNTNTSPADNIQIPTLEHTETNLPEVKVEEVTRKISPTSTPASENPNEETSEETSAGSSSSDSVRGESSTSLSNNYRVVYVEEDDTLNLRNGPGIENDILAEISPNADGVKVVGKGQMVLGSLWVPVEYEDMAGWVNSRFLSQEISRNEFCEDEEIEELVASAYQAIISRDGSQLNGLVAEDRSFRIRRHWWNPEVVIGYDEIAGLFDDVTSYDWGIADGTGDPIEGSLSEIVVPLIDRDLKDFSESSCNEILHGGTAGLVQIPPTYEGINYYSFYRAAEADEIEFDWGTWVLGIEIWQGTPSLSYLVHYEWEI